MNILHGMATWPTLGGHGVAKPPTAADNEAEMYRNMRDVNYHASVLDIGALNMGAIPNPGAIATDAQRMAQLEMRMRMTSSEMRRKMSGLGTTLEGDTVFVHFIRNGEMQVFTDPSGMFPSDALVNNLRLCL